MRERGEQWSRGGEMGATWGKGEAEVGERVEEEEGAGRVLEKKMKFDDS